MSCGTGYHQRCGKDCDLGNVEGIRDVILDDSVSDELLDFARKILQEKR